VNQSRSAGKSDWPLCAKVKASPAKEAGGKTSPSAMTINQSLNTSQDARQFARMYTKLALDRRETIMGRISWLKRARLVAALVIAVITVLGVATGAGAATQQPVDTHPTADPGKAPAPGDNPPRE
jgi:hypothetical protein